MPKEFGKKHLGYTQTRQKNELPTSEMLPNGRMSKQRSLNKMEVDRDTMNRPLSKYQNRPSV